MCTVGLALVCPPLGDSSRKALKSVDGAVPVDTSVCDGDTLLQTARSLRWDLLVAFVDVGFDHDTNNAGLTVADLVGDVLGYEGLVAVVLVGVTYQTLVYAALAFLHIGTYRVSSRPS